jgi:desulfoferrodoxin-like iron-binding protein
MSDEAQYPEWTTEEWTHAWTIHVGKAYRCEKCETMIMVTKGGVGTLEPICCGEPMKLVEQPDTIADT